MAATVIGVGIKDVVYSNPSDVPLSDMLGSATNMVKLVKSTTELTKAPKRLLVGTAGTANITDMFGNDHDNVPLPAGEVNLMISKLRTGGTANDIWALY